MVMDDELYHHGIKGMKWGVRRYQNSDGSLTPAGARRQAKLEDRRARRDRANRSKNRRNLSDADLDSQINRLQKEKKLKELTEADLHPGRVAVKQILATSGKKVVGAAIAGGLAYAGKRYLTKKGYGWDEMEELARYMFPNPNKK